MEEATVTSFNILSESTEIIHVVLVFVQLVGMLSIVFSPLYIQLDTTAVNITFQMQKKSIHVGSIITSFSHNAY